MKRKWDPFQQQETFPSGKTARKSSLQTNSYDNNCDSKSACDVQLTTNIAMRPNISIPDDNQLENVHPHGTLFPECPEYFAVAANDDYRSIPWVEDDDWGGAPSFIGESTLYGMPGRRLLQCKSNESDSANSEDPNIKSSAQFRPQVVCLSQSPPAFPKLFALHRSKLVDDMSSSNCSSDSFDCNSSDSDEGETGEEQNQLGRNKPPTIRPYTTPRSGRGSFCSVIHGTPRRWEFAPPLCEMPYDEQSGPLHASPLHSASTGTPRRWDFASPLCETPYDEQSGPLHASPLHSASTSTQDDKWRARAGSSDDVGSISSLERDSVGSYRIPLGVEEQLTTASISAPGEDGSSSFRGLQSQRPSLNKDSSWRCSEPITAPVVGPASWRRKDSLPDHAPSCCNQDFSTPDPLIPRHLDHSTLSSPRFQWTHASPLSDRGFSSSPNNNSQSKTRAIWSYDENDFEEVHNMPFIDTHCHLDFLFKRLNFSGTLSSFKSANPSLFPESFGGCVAVFCDPKSFGKENSWKYLIEDGNVWGAFGCHPHMANQFNEVAKRQLEIALSHPKVVALGEIGLDYSSNNSCDREIQKSVFRYQIRLALKLDLTIIIHAREAEEDTMIIMKELIPRHWKIHRHCFGEDWPSAQKLLEYFPNLFIGLTALVTFPSAKVTHEVAKYIPLDRLVLETDAPYFVPKKLSRTTRVSNPGMAIHVAAQIAALRIEDFLKDVLIATRKNTKYLYGI